MSGAPHPIPSAPWTGPRAGRQRAAAWVYGGIWGVLTRYFRVPAEPPSLPVAPGETLHAFQPAPGFLRYLKFIFWIWLTIIDGALLIGWILVLAASPMAGVITAPVFLALAVLPDIAAYIAIHLRYDTTWYLLSARSLRIRRGIWTIHETTLTFENVQNVEITQGPLQRYFGISSLLVQTAGGGGGSGAEHGAGGGSTTAHRGLIEGVDDAPRIRDLILARAARARGAGLGDERDAAPADAAASAAWTAEHLNVLREIRDVASAMAG